MQYQHVYLWDNLKLITFTKYFVGCLHFSVTWERILSVSWTHFGCCQYSRWILKSLSIFDDSTTIRSTPNLNLIPEKKNSKKWTTKLDKSDKQWKQMTLVTSKWMSIKVQLMFEKEMGIHAKKKSNFYAQQSLSDGKMKKIQTKIHRLFTNIHAHPTRLFKNQMDWNYLYIRCI